MNQISFLIYSEDGVDEAPWQTRSFGLALLATAAAMNALRLHSIPRLKVESEAADR